MLLCPRSSPGPDPVTKRKKKQIKIKARACEAAAVGQSLAPFMPCAHRVIAAGQTRQAESCLLSLKWLHCALLGLFPELRASLRLRSAPAPGPAGTFIPKFRPSRERWVRMSLPLSPGLCCRNREYPHFPLRKRPPAACSPQPHPPAPQICSQTGRGRAFPCQIPAAGKG